MRRNDNLYPYTAIPFVLRSITASSEWFNKLVLLTWWFSSFISGTNFQHTLYSYIIIMMPYHCHIHGARGNNLITALCIKCGICVSSQHTWHTTLVQHQSNIGSIYLACSLDIQRCYNVESTSMTLIQCGCLVARTHKLTLLIIIIDNYHGHMIWQRWNIIIWNHETIPRTRSCYAELVRRDRIL